MRNLFKILIVIITLLFNSKVISQSSIETVETLFKATKIDLDFGQINAIVDNKIKEKKSSISEDKYSVFSKAIKENFNSRNAIGYLKEYFLENEKESDLIKIIELYNMPLMIKMNNYEQGFYNPENKQKQMAFFKKMKTTPPNQERVNLLLSLNETLKATIKTKDLLEKIMIAFSQGYNLTLPKEQQLEKEKVRAKAKLELPQNFSQQITNQFVAIGLYTYKDASDDELKKYIQVWKTDIGKKYTDMIFNSYEAIFEKISINLVKNLNKAF